MVKMEMVGREKTVEWELVANAGHIALMGDGLYILSINPDGTLSRIQGLEENDSNIRTNKHGEMLITKRI